MRRAIYGPVPSWRLGRSLGVDLLSVEEKTCSFNCVYCQLGETVRLTTERRPFVTTELVLKEWDELPPLDLDYITFSGTGEPTLAANLGECAAALRQRTEVPLAVLTNASLVSHAEVREDLACFDLVIAKLDAPNRRLFSEVNRPAPEVDFGAVLEGLPRFRQEHRERLALQIMFVPQNDKAVL